MICAPFYGEFGWLVALWAPFLRHMRRMTYDNVDEFLVICEHGHEALFEDFATKVVPITAPPIRRRDCENAWFVDAGRYDNQRAEVARVTGRRIPRKQIISHQQMPVRWDPVPQCMRAIYHRFGEGAVKVPGRIGIHARNCPDKQPERNWPEKCWSDLLVDDLHHKFFDVIAFGTRAAAFSEGGLGLDFRGTTLKDAIAQIARCELMIGPSSGPLVLAMQCGVPVVWWGANEKDLRRFGKTWNPFDVKTLCAANTWTPTSRMVADACRELLKS